jgi:two-component system cell cycle sensor histidine kinase/response regulator CckA
LPTAYAIVKQLSGYINVVSWEGKGSNFEIYLPIHITEEQHDTPQTQPKQRKTRPGRKARRSLRKTKSRAPLILIAEDQHDVLVTVDKFLTRQGYRTITATNGNAALDLFNQLVAQKDKPALVISDLGLPGMDGRTLCKKIRESHPRTALLLTTGHLIDLKENNTKTLDDFHFVQKPFDNTALLDIIQRVIKIKPPAVQTKTPAQPNLSSPTPAPPSATTPPPPATSEPELSLRKAP